MADVTVKQFATVVGIPVNRLLEQLTEAGITVAWSGRDHHGKNRKWIYWRICAKSHGNPPVQGAVEPEEDHAQAQDAKMLL